MDAIDAISAFAADFKTLLMKYPKVDTTDMGSPRGWENEALWE